MHQARVAAIGVTALASLGAGAVFTGWHCNRDWPEWEQFAERFVQADGRVIDYLLDDRSTSEGQAYAMFFALVANDQKRFAATLDWAENNLAQGDLSENLPAWLWGRNAGGEWRVLDANPASDADLWIAYALLEAARLWEMTDYTRLADQILEMIQKQAVVTIPGLGQVLLPAPEGFRPSETEWRLNPSYVPGFLFSRLSMHDPDGPWAEISANNTALLARASDRGLAPDWITFRLGDGVVKDAKTGWLGSYDAIRVYLWSGLTTGAALLKPNSLHGMADIVMRTGGVPERVDVRSGATEGVAPPGFTAALSPYLRALGKPADMPALEDFSGPAGQRPDSGEAQYYDHMLLLFGQGWVDGRYRFGEDGRMETFWSGTCCELFH